MGYIRYLKNIMGLWIIQCVQKQLGISFAEMVELAKTSTYTRIFDVNEARFSAPQDMRAEIRAALAETGEAPATDADLINSIYGNSCCSVCNERVISANSQCSGLIQNLSCKSCTDLVVLRPIGAFPPAQQFIF